MRRSLVLVAVVLAGCGGSANRKDREWVANARGVVQQLRADVVAVEAFDDEALARQAMHDDSQVYGLLVAYSDLGGCRHEVLALGAPPPGEAAAVGTLLRACAPLERAARLFARAMTRNRPVSLVAATHASLRGGALLARAALALGKG